MATIDSLPSRFHQRLVVWAEQINRPLPWRNETDPYRIWLSEILLQQTRAETVIDYYVRFLSRCPTVHDLSNLPTSDLLKLWEGLGYYNRAHNLHKTAGIISRERNGHFPDTYEGLLALPGIGAYTASAIASFAFGLPHAVLDGNVIRVISRLTGTLDPVDQTATKQHLQILASRLMGSADPATFNQAMMDFGAVHCTPRNPDCDTCPFQGDCLAYRMNMVDQLPVKRKKQAVRDRVFVFFPIQRGETLWLVRRQERDIWPDLHTFPAVEITDIPARKQKAHLNKALFDWTGLDIPFTLGKKPLFHQLLSHQRIHGHFIPVSLPARTTVPSDWIAIRNHDFSNHALPRIMRSYLADHLDPDITRRV